MHGAAEEGPADVILGACDQVLDQDQALRSLPTIEERWRGKDVLLPELARENESGPEDARIDQIAPLNGQLAVNAEHLKAQRTFKGHSPLKVQRLNESTKRLVLGAFTDVY